MDTAFGPTDIPVAMVEPAPRPVSRRVRLCRLTVAIVLLVAVVSVFVLLSGGAN